MPERLRGPDQLGQRHQLLLSQPGDSGAARGVLLDGAQTRQDLQLSKAGPSDGTVLLILSISKTGEKVCLLHAAAVLLRHDWRRFERRERHDITSDSWIALTLVRQARSR